MRQSEKEELLARTDEISAQVAAAVRNTVSKDSLAVQFNLGMATAYLNRLKADIADTEAEEDEDDYPELPPNGTMSGLFVGTAGWKADQEASEDEAAADAAEKEAEDTEDVVLPAKKGEQPAAGSGARVKVSRLPDAGTLPPTKEVRVPDEELPKPRRRGGRPKKFTLDEEASDPLE